MVQETPCETFYWKRGEKKKILYSNEQMTVLLYQCWGLILWCINLIPVESLLLPWKNRQVRHDFHIPTNAGISFRSFVRDHFSHVTDIQQHWARRRSLCHRAKSRDNENHDNDDDEASTPSNPPPRRRGRPRKGQGKTYFSQTQPTDVDSMPNKDPNMIDPDWPVTNETTSHAMMYSDDNGMPFPNNEDDDDLLLSYAIDSFLRGDYDGEFADDAPAPHPGLGPGAVVDSALRALRNLDDPAPSHGAAVLLRFCVPLTRGDRWGDTSSSTSSSVDPWKEVMRGALTPSMLARRLRASEFAGLLDWTSLDVTEGAFGLERDLVGVPSIAFVNAAMYFGDGIEPSLIQFTLRRRGGVWLIDTARKSPRELFLGRNSSST